MRASKSINMEECVAPVKQTAAKVRRGDSETATNSDDKSGRYDELRSGRPCAVELFAGSAGLSARLWDSGFDVLSFDSKFNKHKAKRRKTGVPVPVLPLDLTREPDQEMIRGMVAARKPRLVWMSLPSGSFTVQPVVPPGGRRREEG